MSQQRPRRVGFAERRRERRSPPPPKSGPLSAFKDLVIENGAKNVSCQHREQAVGQKRRGFQILLLVLEFVKKLRPTISSPDSALHALPSAAVQCSPRSNTACAQQLCPLSLELLFASIFNPAPHKPLKPLHASLDLISIPAHRHHLRLALPSPPPTPFHSAAPPRPHPRQNRPNPARITFQCTCHA